MVSHPSRPDVVVVGAGAAGLAAGRELRRLGVSALIVEARDRVGGRAWTLPCSGGRPLDLGCEWLHAARQNILATLAPDLGFVIDTSDPPWTRPAPQVGHGAEDRRAFRLAHATFEARLREAALIAEVTGQDRPAADLLDPDCRWNGLLDAVSTYFNGAPLARVSVVDYGRYHDTDDDWRVAGGYGALIAATGAGLAIKLGVAVRAIDATGRALAIETAEGTIETDAVIVTVPTSVLAAGAIAFRPALDAHLAAAAALPLGVADKLYLAIENPEAFEPDTRVIGATDRAETGSYTLRPGGRPMIEGYFGGDYARALEGGGLPAFAAAARDELGAALGHDIARRTRPLRATGWARDPLSLGSYSHALPGQADARAVLATPAGKRVFFAGEATSRHFFSTAHGAFESGLGAARAAAAYVEKRKGFAA
jgi:monoamine oxidase